MSDDKLRRSGPAEPTVVIPGTIPAAKPMPAMASPRTGNPDRTIQGVIVPRAKGESRPPPPPPRGRAAPAVIDPEAPPSAWQAAPGSPARLRESVFGSGSIAKAIELAQPDIAGAPPPAAAGTPPPMDVHRRSRPDSGMLPTGGPSRSEITGTPMAPGQVPQPGMRIAHYELIRELGTGGMGTVFLARDLKLGRKVAIKILQAQDPELARRFLVEARATARCHHENIVVIYEVGAVGDQPYMVLEYLKGETLIDLVRGGKRLPPARVLELMIPVVRALIAAHEQGIVHRDLKPDNIFVTESGSIKVLDFGIAKIHERGEQQTGLVVPSEARTFTGDTDLTRPGMIMGTVKYMSPEQWGIGIEIDHRTDIWAVGIMLFRMLSGRHPLAPMTGNQLVVTAMLEQPMPRLRTVAPDVPQGLADVVDRCLQKVKDGRWANARELLHALEPFQPSRHVTRALAADESPYAGLASFQETDAAKFHGRGREIVAAVQRVRERPILAIAGPSGVGKSSFVRAGLFPALKAGGETWETMTIRPGRSPMAALAALTAPMVGKSSSTTLVDDIKEQQEEIDRLLREPGHLGLVLRSRAKREKCKILLFVDQFEELYTLVTDPKERLGFTTALASAADDAGAPVRVVVSLRSDFLDRVSEDPAFVTEVTHGLCFLGTPARDGLRDALVQPAEMAGYQFETPMMVDDMLAHLETTPGALPLLQFAASKLWEKRDNVQKLMTLSAYQAMGGIAGALATHADAVVAELPPPAQQLARAVFLRLVTPDRTRAIVSLAELDELSPGTGDVRRLIDQLVAARLLVVSSTGEGGLGSTTIEIVHESLIHSWPALRRWLEETAEDSAFIDQLRVAAKQWHSRGRPTGLLWRGSDADDVRHWARRGRTGMLTEIQRAFVEALLLEANRVERRRSVVTIVVVATLALLLVAAVGVALKIRTSEKRANDQAAQARRAEQDAKRALAAAEDKERQRLAAEALKAAAEADKDKAVLAQNVAEGNLEAAYKELEVKNNELQDALAKATEEQSKARSEEERAEKAADAAKRAQSLAEQSQAEAVTAKREAEKLYQQEKARRQKLEEQLGSPMVDTLK